MGRPKTKVISRGLYTRTTTRSGKQNWRPKFLEALTKIPNVSAAANTARVTPKTVYEHRKTDSAFREAWDAALLIGIEGLEETAWRISNEGIEKGVWMKDNMGNPVKVDTVKEYPIQLMMFLMRAHKPEKYMQPKDEVSLKTTSPDGTTSEFVVCLNENELP